MARRGRGSLSTPDPAIFTNVASELRRLIYFSSATRELPDAELVELLAISRRNNAALGITGALLHHDRQFVQILEGPDAEVRRMFERIRQDSRHGAIGTVDSALVDERIFAGFTMGWVTAATVEAEGFDPRLLRGQRIDDATVRVLLSTFRLGVRL
jgi:hypothetical protein